MYTYEKGSRRDVGRGKKEVCRCGLCAHMTAPLPGTIGNETKMCARDSKLFQMENRIAREHDGEVTLIIIDFNLGSSPAPCHQNEHASQI